MRPKMAGQWEFNFWKASGTMSVLKSKGLCQAQCLTSALVWGSLTPERRRSCLGREDTDVASQSRPKSRHSLNLWYLQHHHGTRAVNAYEGWGMDQGDRFRQLPNRRRKRKGRFLKNLVKMSQHTRIPKYTPKKCQNHSWAN